MMSDRVKPRWTRGWCRRRVWWRTPRRYSWYRQSANGRRSILQVTSFSDTFRQPLRRILQ